MNVSKSLALLFALLMLPLAVSAQDTTAALPTAAPPAIPPTYNLVGVRYEPQHWNNCGPATLTNALSYYDYGDNQDRAANWLKPNTEDKNVSPWQMAEFVNTQVPELNVYAKVRYGGTIDRIKLLIANNFPVITEQGYDLEAEGKGWMGHYLLVTGYNDAKSLFYTYDSYMGPNKAYTYTEFEEMWQHFNYVYLTLYPTSREAEVNALLGSDADERQNVINSLELARSQAVADNTDAFAWFNMGSNFVMLEMYNEAAIAYDQARSIGLPWRMMWYQFGPFEAYYHTGRYDDMIALSQTNLADGGGQYVEETYYYGGLAREAKGEADRALVNFNNAVEFNPNFSPAKDAIRVLTQQQDGGS
jgi:hypothetical protein